MIQIAKSDRSSLISSSSMMVMVARSGEMVTQSGGSGLNRVMEKVSISSSSRLSSRIPNGIVCVPFAVNVSLDRPVLTKSGKKVFIILPSDDNINVRNITQASC